MHHGAVRQQKEGQESGAQSGASMKLTNSRNPDLRWLFCWNAHVFPLSVRSSRVPTSRWTGATFATWHPPHNLSYSVLITSLIQNTQILFPYYIKHLLKNEKVSLLSLRAMKISVLIITLWVNSWKALLHFHLANYSSHGNHNKLYERQMKINFKWSGIHETWVV